MPDLLSEVLGNDHDLVAPGSDGRQVVATVTDLTRRLLEVDDCWLQPAGPAAELLLAAYHDASDDVSVTNTAVGPLSPGGTAGYGRGVAVAVSPVHLDGEDHVLVAWQRSVRAWTPRDRRMLARAARELEQLLEQRTGMASAEQHARARFDALRTDILVTLDHELRTPMTILRTGLELLADSLEDTGGEHTWLLDRLDSSMERLRGLADNVGHLAHSTADPDPTDEVDVAVAPVVAEALERVGPGAGIDVRVDLDPDLAVAVDAQDLRILLERLLDNAVKFCGDEGRVTVSAATADGRVELVITDTGIGIADDEHFQLGVPFYRTTETKRLEHQGPGLGLAVARSVVSRWRGRLVLENRLTGGVAARVSLPAAR